MCVLKDWIVPIFTILGVIVNGLVAYFAIHGKRIRDKIYSPVLQLEYKNDFPWTNGTKYATAVYTTLARNTIQCSLYGNAAVDNVTTVHKDLRKAWSFKIKVINKGDVAAKNVQVYLKSIKRRATTGIFEDCKNVLPMNLVWSYQDNEKHPTATRKSIAAGAEKYCDFIFVDDNSRCFLRTEAEFPVYDEQHNLTDNVTLPKGKYQCEVTVLASNAEPYSETIEFEYTGQWDNDSRNVIKYKEES